MNINDYTETVGFGTGANRTKFESDGTMKMEGTATVWDDVTGSLLGKALSSQSGKVGYDWAENTIVFNSGGNITVEADRVAFNVQIPHAAITDGTIDLHIHWEQDTATAREFTIKHRVQNNGSTKTTTWTETIVSTAADAKFTYTSGTINQISDLKQIDLTGIGISAVVQFQIARTDSETGDLHSTFLDIHVVKNTFGSRLEYTK